MRAKQKAGSQEERLQKRKEYFKNLFGKPHAISNKPTEKIINCQQDIKLGHFTEEERDTVLKKMKSRKAADFDEISQEVWKKFADTFF